MLLKKLLIIASGLTSTTYGHGAKNCGDIGAPRACIKGAVTASGIEFDPLKPIVAIAAPTKMRLKAQWIWLRYENRDCQLVLLADKMNPRYIGKRGFDLTPAAVWLLTGKPATRYWSGKIHVCTHLTNYSLEEMQ